MLDNLLTEAIEAAIAERDAEDTSEGVRFLCPSHDDHDPSARWNREKEVWFCDACEGGGGARDLASRLGISVPGGERVTIISDPLASSEAAVPASPEGAGLTVEAYAKAKGLRPDFLGELGVTNFYLYGRPAIGIPYRDTSGEVVAVRQRVAMSGKSRFRWRSGDKPVLYGLDRRSAAREAGYVVIVEGESDAQTCWQHGIPALGVPGASNWKDERDLPHLEGIERIYVVVEPDQGGETLLASLTATAVRDRLRLVRLGQFKDVSALFLNDPERFTERLREALDGAPQWIDEEVAERRRVASEAWDLAENLLTAQDLMGQVASAMQGSGYAGDLHPPLIAYIAMTSRLMPKPINLALVAPSAAGKNRAVRAASSLMPAEAVYEVSAASPLALVYTPRDLRHSVVIVAEADAIPDEGRAATAVRTLAEDNELIYETAVRNPSTGKFTTQRIEKPGPISFITTSTESVKHQLGTRMLEVAVRDDEAQTAQILMVQAAEAAGHRRSGVDVAPFLAAQRWLAAQGEVDVVVPFAPALSVLVFTREVRMRRDFVQMLCAIKTVALLHCCQRARDDSGNVIATIEDYAYVRWLFGPVFDQIEAGGATPGVRSVVAAVAELNKSFGAVSLGQVVRHLNGPAKSTVDGWVRRALKGEWLVDGRPHPRAQRQLSVGDRLPAESSALPAPEDVVAEFERSPGGGSGSPPPPLEAA